MNFDQFIVREINAAGNPKNRLNISSVTTLTAPVSFDDFSIKFVVAGKEIYHLNGDTYVVGSGEYVIGNKTTSALVEINGQQPSEGICTYLSAQLIGEVAEVLAPNASNPLDTLLSANLFIGKTKAKDTALGAKLSRFSCLMNQVAPDELTLENEFFYGVAEAVIQDQFNTERALHNLGAKKWATNTHLLRCLLEAKHYIDEHFDQKLDIKQLTLVCGISEYHFTRLFKQAFHFTPYQYIIQTRLKQAAYLLEKQVPATEVALSVGFADLASFSKSFKKYYHHSPKTFQQKSSF